MKLPPANMRFDRSVGANRSATGTYTIIQIAIPPSKPTQKLFRVVSSANLLSKEVIAMKTPPARRPTRKCSAQPVKTGDDKPSFVAMVT